MVHARLPSASAVDAQDAPSWTADHRLAWVTNSLKVRLRDMRNASARCRKAFNEPYMGVPANWLADVYADAANVLAAGIERAEGVVALVPPRAAKDFETDAIAKWMANEFSSPSEWQTWVGTSESFQDFLEERGWISPETNIREQS